MAPIFDKAKKKTKNHIFSVQRRNHKEITARRSDHWRHYHLIDFVIYNVLGACHVQR